MDGDDLTYAIGDIHGCADQLDRLLAEIERHRAGRPRRIVCLGDYVDRGPDSARVIATLRGLQEREPGRITCLKGNHEAMLLGALSGADEPLWLFNGGRAVLASYGVTRVDQLPRADLDWIAALPTLHEDEAHWYVHAGFRPGRPAPDPDVERRLWIREPFLSADHDFGKHVVHGHTPLRDGQPEVRRHRTNLDTGAVFGGPLTAGVFIPREGPPAAFLQVL